MIEVRIGEAASYAAAGVNIDAGDDLSQIWNNAGQQTYANRAGRLGQLSSWGVGFTGYRGIDLDLLQSKLGLDLVGGVDGVGTKPELAERATERRRMQSYVDVKEPRDHTGIPADVIAMTADDLARDGAEPLAQFLLFDASTLSRDDARDITGQLAEGTIAACKDAEVVLLNGETAELGDRVGGYGNELHYSLGGTAIGVAHRSRILDGSAVRPGQAVVAFREKGFRANGMSLVRKVLTAEFGPQWHLEDEDLAAQALRPSKIYSAAFVALHGGYDIAREPAAHVSAIVHVTGGGLPGKLQRKLGMTGHGAVLEDLFEPPVIMQRMQAWSMNHANKGLDTPDGSMYQTWNGGNGALVVTEDPDRVIAAAAQFGVDGRHAGEIVENPGIEVKSRGVTHTDQWIRFIPRGV
jgi:phosphoribosylformylglycinamidine cyclo-ligase